MDKELLTIVKNLKEDDGVTFKKGIPVRYKTGYQVGLQGLERKTCKAVVNAIKKFPSVGIWLHNKIYYIDVTKRIPTKKEAITIGKECKQQSIYDWKKNDLVWL
jgi:hypothetical protein